MSVLPVARPMVVWHGSNAESLEPVKILAANCTCEFGLMGVRLATCVGHKMLVEDQRALDGLVFVRRMAEKLLLQEFSGAPYEPEDE